MIAPSPSLDVLRHGWLDAAAVLAPDRPEIAEFLEQRLADVVASGRLTENDLLDTVSEIEAAAADIGVPTGVSLGTRLRRTVYEYLLALDATSAVEGAEPQTGSPLAFHVLDGDDLPTQAPDEVAEAQPDDIAEADDSGWSIRQPDAPIVVGAASWSPPDDDVSTETQADGESASDHVTSSVDTDDRELIPATDGEDDNEDHHEPVAEPDAELVSELGSFSPPSGETEPVQQADADTTDATGGGFIAPRHRFHITDDTDMEASAAPAAPIDGAPVTFAALDRPQAEAPTEPAAEEAPVWRVRPARAGARREAEARGDALENVADQPDDPFELDARLLDQRQRIQEKLRKKKCDEAAALLQSMAQETGGRAVAELAMDAGDRCRALGKTNAALNCYLAASRADPIFEQPLHRLADICIDDQDVDLAVSYLERIARLHQLRGDEREALRVYRRIVTVAPFREDILTMLMSARNSGQLSS